MVAYPFKKGSLNQQQKLRFYQEKKQKKKPTKDGEPFHV